PKPNHLRTTDWLGAPSCQRGSFSFYKSVGSRTRPDGPLRTFRLGEFYFIRCGPRSPCVTLLWEDQTQRHPLASARLYFLPEDTPKGRTADHGEDEVLAVSRKMVVKVEDLARWSCLDKTNGWKIPSRTAPPNPLRTGHAQFSRHPRTKIVNMVSADVAGRGPEGQWVKVLSYPQYCRYHSLQRRTLGQAAGLTLQDPLVLALGGIKVALSHTRVMYCRDTFNHPTLEANACFSWQFSE
uniref:Uncharacterized protein n=1 Tax=Neogobius melanostomus TaxID=47308 RepID=A0A8C6TAM2_9GOBI